MAKYATEERVGLRAPVKSTDDLGSTHEGGDAFAREAESDLFIMAVSSFMEDGFYESAEKRRTDLAKLVRTVTQSNPAFVESLMGWLRGPEANLRSAPVVIACEYIAGGGTDAVAISGVLQRVDDMAEMMAYWRTFHRRTHPKIMRRAVKLALARGALSEYGALKYSASERGWTPSDVIELVHPKPSTDEQGALFRYLIDARHDRDPRPETLALLPKIAGWRELARMTPEEARKVISNPSAGKALADVGMTWERVAGWLQGPMDKVAWEAMIPTMGYMALLRNLRNFEETGVSDVVLDQVSGKLASADEVAKSRQLPFRFFTAWQHSGTMRFGRALEQALDASVSNVPAFPGRTLILVDVSSSMWQPVSGRSKAVVADLAAVFGSALALRAESPTLVGFGTHSTLILVQGRSVLRQVETIRALGRQGATYGWQAIADHYAGHDRVIAITDEQWHPGLEVEFDPKTYFWVHNLAGHAGTVVPQAGSRRKFNIGGVSDASFKVMAAIEAGRHGQWPWE